ncbi:hypothetical protein FI667_g15976, partial [Globisporangium splendens]
MLDPRAPSTSALAFAIALFNTLSTHSPLMLTWFAKCQRVQLLFDLLLVDQAYTSSLSLQIRHAFVSSLLELCLRVLQLHPDMRRWFIIDPRLLYRVVQHVYCLRAHAQLAALELIHELTKSSTIVGTIFRVEYFSCCFLCVVEDRMVDGIQERCLQLQIPPELHPRVVALTCLLQLPLFLDLKTAELVRVSMCVVEGSDVENESLMIIAEDERFGRITEQRQVLRRVDEELKRIVAMKRAEGSLMHFKIQEDAHAPTGLLTRVHRFLTEDRAELIRRVAFTKQYHEQAILAEVSKKKINDVLSLLHDCPLFEGLDRGALACLAYRLSSPKLVSVDTFRCDQEMPLMLLVGDDVECFASWEFPQWLVGNPESNSFLLTQTRVRRKLFVVTLTYEILLATLGTQGIQRLIQAYTTQASADSHELQPFKMHMARPTRSSVERKQQIAGLTLLRQCVVSREFAIQFLKNTWAVQIIYEIAISALWSHLVMAALDVLCSFAEGELVCKLVCAVPIPTLMTMFTIAKCKPSLEALDARKVGVLVRLNQSAEKGMRFPIRVKIHMKIFRSDKKVRREFQVTFITHSAGESLSDSFIVDDAGCAIKAQSIHQRRQWRCKWVVDARSTPLSHNVIDLSILKGATRIVAELCKSTRIFCDLKLKLWDHLLSAMKQQADTATNMPDTSSLYSKTSMIPILRLIQGMRKYGFVVDTVTWKCSQIHHPQRSKAEDNHDVLTRLIEWTAAMKVPECTENYLNILFMENTDVLHSSARKSSWHGVHEPAFTSSSFPCVFSRQSLFSQRIGKQ